MLGRAKRADRAAAEWYSARLCCDRRAFLCTFIRPPPEILSLHNHSFPGPGRMDNLLRATI